MAERDVCPIPAKRSKVTDVQPTTAEEAKRALLKSKEIRDDVTFVVGRKLYREQDKIQGHQTCLRALSLVFDHMLETSRKDARAKIKLTDINPGAFQVLLEFFYGDKFVVSVAEALDVLYLADRYGVGPLMKSAKICYSGELLSP